MVQKVGILVVLLAVGTASGFSISKLYPAHGASTTCAVPGLRTTCLKSSLRDWTHACEKNDMTAPIQPLPADDLTALLKAVMFDPKRKSTFAEVGGGRGEAMAVACEMYSWDQAALFLPEDMQKKAEGLFAAAKESNKIFEPCQIILGNPVDHTRASEWGLGADGAATTLAAAAGQNCLEKSRIVTVGRKLVDEEGVWNYALLQTLKLGCGAEGYVWEVARSAKSTPPDRALLPPAGHVKGAWVKLVGLQKAPDLNGAVAVILEVDEGKELLSVMLDDTCQIIKVRAKNAQPVSVDP